MRTLTRLLTAALATLTMLPLIVQPGRVQARPPAAPPGPDRFAGVIVPYTAYEWWLVEYSGSDLECIIVLDREGQPGWSDIYDHCPLSVYNAWKVQKPCPPATLETDPSACPGYYLFLADSYETQREIAVALPAASVAVSLEGCTALPALGTNICPGVATLVLTGVEPLPNEHILRLEGNYDGQAFECAATCKFELGPTLAAGIALDFWAFSSYGDSSLVFEALVRVQPTDDNDPEQRYWYVDVLSAQWAGSPQASCGQAWQSFPPVGGVPGWLSTPVSVRSLYSEIPYTYLAGNLIQQGEVDASDCPSNGLMPNGAANTCGLGVARPAVIAWQNQFDAEILAVARQTGIPAQLLKNLFAQESQFWPGVYREDEAGLGQLTADGADTTLLWNPAFFDQFCPLVLSERSCLLGYYRLKEDDRDTLRAALVNRVNLDCPNCLVGLDLSQSNFSIGVFAHTLLANCEQTGMIIHNLTDTSPGDAASYEDLWRFTLVNYNAGPGCLGEAIDQAQAEDQPLTWANLVPRLDPACQAAINYVNSIAREP